MKSQEIKQWDIVYVESEKKCPHGSVLYKSRPGVVISNDKGNMHSNIAIVAWLSTSLKRPEMVTHEILSHYEGLRKVSMLKAEQLQTIDQEDVLTVMDHLRPEDIVRVRRAVMASLGLEVQDAT